MKGRIVKIISNQYTVMDAEHKKYRCVAMGKLRLKESPVVGDYVEVQRHQDVFGIEKVYPRRNGMIRPSIANVDQVIVVMSAVEPDFSCTLVDRLMFLIQYEEIQPILCVTKLDLVQTNHEVYSWIEDYKKSGFQVLLCEMNKPDEKIAEILKDKVTVLTGQSGAGKSTLINGLDSRFELKTQDISKALGRGKHTTRHTELHEVAGGLLADTPGFSSLDFSQVDLRMLSERIQDFKDYSPLCKFRNCIHQNEPKCAVKQGVEDKKISSIRYQNYLECIALIKKERDV